MNITVYLGAFEGKDASLKQAVRELGTWIGASGNALVYGGSKSGLMGENCRERPAGWRHGDRRGTEIFHGCGTAI